MFWTLAQFTHNFIHYKILPTLQQPLNLRLTYSFEPHILTLFEPSKHFKVLQTFDRKRLAKVKK